MIFDLSSGYLLIVLGIFFLLANSFLRIVRHGVRFLQVETAKETIFSQKVWVIKVLTISNKNGYVELWSFLKIITEGIAFFCATHIFERSIEFKSVFIQYLLAGTQAVVLVYGVSYLLVPLTFKAFPYRLLYPCYLIWFIVWKLLSWLGILLHYFHQYYLKMMGYYRRLNINPTQKSLSSEAKIVSNIYDLSYSSVSEVLSPLSSIVALPIDANYEKVLEVVTNCKFTFFPVYDKDIDHIQGILDTKNLLSIKDSSKFDLLDIIDDACFIPITQRLFDVVNKFKINCHNIVIVVDEYGSTVGLVNLNDILEDIIDQTALG